MDDNVFSLELEESPGGSASESDRTINKNISSIISMLNTPSPNARRDHSPAIPDTAPILLLQGVIAFVDVRSTYENRSKAITNQLLQLGATVEPKLTNEVTHVIFKDGKKSTRDKAKKKGLHFVSVLWIEACKRNAEHVPEKNYPANVKDESGLPLAITRLKKNKSMQPKDFEEELANSAEKVERRRKRLEKKEKWKVLETPVTPQQYNRGQFYVAETQSMSPMHLFASNISIPETPPSMRRKLEALRRKKQGGESMEGLSIQESPTTPPVSELQKRLFCSNNTTPSASSCSSIMASPVISRPQSPLTTGLLLTEKIPPSQLTVHTCSKGIMPLSADTIPPVRFSLFDEESLSSEYMPFAEKPSQEITTSKRKSLSAKHKSSSSVTSLGGSLQSKQTIHNQSDISSCKEKSLKHIAKASSNLSPINPLDCDKSTGLKHITDMDTPAMEDFTTGELRAGNSGKCKSRKKKLLSLEDHLPENLLSPVVYPSTSQAKSDGLQFPKPKKPTKGNNTMVLPTSGKSKSRGRKRKTDELTSSDADESLSVIQKRTKSDVECKPMERVDKCDLVGEELSVVSKSKSDAKSTKGRRKSMAVTATSVTPRVTRRRSCMPVSTPGGSNLASVQKDISNIRSSNLSQVQKDISDIRCSKSAVESVIDSESQPPPCAMDIVTPEMVSTGKNPAPIRVSRRKSLQPQKSPVKPMTTIIHRRSHRSMAPPASTLSRDCDTKLDKCNDVTPAEDVIPSLLSSSASDVSTHSNSTAYSISKYDNTTISSIAASRRSIEEFLLPKYGRLKMKAISMSSAVDSSGSDAELEPMGCHGLKSSQETKSSRGLSKIVKKKIMKNIDKKMRHNSGSSSDGSCCSVMLKQEVLKKRKDGCSKSLVMTSLHSDEQDSVRAVTKKLGGFFIEECVSSRTTHVVCGSNRRTLNILLGISKGCWILSLEWVFKSLEADHWLEEDQYEQHKFFPAAQISRIAKMSGGHDEYQSDFFSQDGLIYVAENTAPSHEDLVHLLHLCGAQVTHCARKAQVCIGSSSTRADIINVSEKWILDSITSHERLPFDNYRL